MTWLNMVSNSSSDVPLLVERNCLSINYMNGWDDMMTGIIISWHGDWSDHMRWDRYEIDMIRYDTMSWYDIITWYDHTHTQQ